MNDRKSDLPSAAENAEEKMYSIRVWDIPTRLFHWLLVALIVFSFATGKIGGDALKYHEWSGFAIIVLVVFRLVWGFMGRTFLSAKTRHFSWYGLGIFQPRPLSKKINRL